MSADRAYWDAVYGQGETTRSWYQPLPEESLQLLAGTGWVTPRMPPIG